MKKLMKRILQLAEKVQGLQLPEFKDSRYFRKEEKLKSDMKDSK